MSLLLDLLFNSLRSCSYLFQIVCGNLRNIVVQEQMISNFVAESCCDLHFAAGQVSEKWSKDQLQPGSKDQLQL
jgi:hypothetical protein